MQLGSEIFIVPVICALIYGIFHLIIRRKERLIMIEKGNDYQLKDETLTISPYKLGCFLIGIGFGFVFAEIISKTTLLERGSIYFAMIFIFAGAGLIIGHVLDENRKKNKPTNNMTE